MSDDELISWLTKDRDCDEAKARALIAQINVTTTHRKGNGSWSGLKGTDSQSALQEPDPKAAR